MKVCVVGTSRTGSTLVRDMLHRHPGLVLFNETHWLPRMYERCGTAEVRWNELLAIARKTTWSTGQSLLEVNLAHSPFASVEELIEALSARLARVGYLGVREFHEIAAEICLSPVADWGDKTPDYGYHMRLLQSLWPRCRFLHVVRNGLDTARSMSEHNGSRLMAAGGSDNWCFLSYDGLYAKYAPAESPLEGHVASWRRRLARIRAEAEGLAPGSYREIRYDEILAHPREALAAVGEWLEIGADATWLGEVAQLPRPGRQWEDAALELGLRLLPDDLRALRREGGLAFARVPLPDDRDTLLRFLHELAPFAAGTEDKAVAARAGLAVLGSEAWVTDVEVAEAAVAAVLPAVQEELGAEGVERWAAWLADVRAATGRRR